MTGQKEAMEALLDVEETRKLLRLSRAKLYLLIGSGELPVVKLDRRTLFRPAAVRRFIADRESKPKKPRKTR